MFDLIDDMISYYELSINLEDNTSNKVTIQCYSYESASFDLIGNMISDDELSINFKSIEINNTPIRPPLTISLQDPQLQSIMPFLIETGSSPL